MLTKSLICLSLILLTAVRSSAHQLDNEYSQDFTDLIELVYGQGLLSQGGNESIDRMFEGVDITGKKMLDIGSGLGGVEFYLASNHCTDIVGLDCVSRMVCEAQQRQLDYQLQGLVHFVHHEPETYPLPFESESFDIIFSKEALLHVTDKGTLIKELHRLLKPGGKLIIIDWLIQNEHLGPHITHMMEIDGLDLKMATPAEYQAYLKQAGFTAISLTLLNDRYVSYTNDNIATIEKHKDVLMLEIGHEEFEYSLNTWGIQKKIFECNEVLVTHITAQKQS